MPDQPADNKPLIDQLLQKRADVVKNPNFDNPENKRDGVREKKLAKIDAELKALGYKGGN
jgi:hypothetical protein